MNQTASAAYEQALGQATQLLSSAEYARAMHLARHLVQMRPSDCRPFYLLGLALNGQRQFTAAIEPLKHATRLEPASPELWLELGKSFNGENRLPDAEACYRSGLVQQPSDRALRFSLARNLEAQRQTVAALELYRQLALSLPADTSIREGLWRCLRNLGLREELCQACNHGLAETPVLRLLRAKTLIELHTPAALAEAESLLLLVLATEPRNRDALLSITLLYRLLSEYERCHATAQKLIELYPERTDGYAGCIEALIQADRDEEAIKLGWESTRCGTYAVLMHAATFMAPIPHSTKHISRERERARTIIAAMLAKRIIIANPLLDAPLTRFYYAYHGRNNKAELGYLADSLRKLAPSLNYQANHIGQPRLTGPLRIAFISSFMYNHPAGRCFQPLVEALAKKADVAITVFTHLKSNDIIQDKLREHSISVNALPKSLEQARESVQAIRPDVIIYSDIGMDVFTYYLAFSRLAPLQCQLAGHPESSGIDTIDYFISQKDSEGPQPQSRYREQCVLLDNFAMDYPTAQHVQDSRSRAELDLPAERFYLVPAKLQKIHPDFDAVIAGILRRDPDSVALFFKDHTCTGWASLFNLRFTAQFPELATRLRFRNWAEKEDFQAILSHSDAIIDPIHFGLGTTALYAFAQGEPIITRPYDNMAGRPVAALLLRMGITELIAKSDDELIALAVSLANEPARRKALGKRILNAYPTLFHAGNAADELLQLFHHALQQKLALNQRPSATASHRRAR